MPSNADWKHRAIRESRLVHHPIREWHDLLVMLRGFLSGQKQSAMARALGLDAATVTTRLNHLQEETGCELHRGTLGTHKIDRAKAALNYPLARALERRLSRLMAAWNDVDQLLQSEGRADNQAAVGGSRTAMAKWFPTFLAASGWLAAHRHAQLDCTHKDSMDELLGGLELMAYDFVLGPGHHTVPQFVRQESVQLRWGLIYSKNHPCHSDFDAMTAVELADFKGYGPVLLRPNPEINMEAYLPPPDGGDCPRVFISSFIQAIGWIRQGLGVGFGSILHVEGSKNLRWKPLRCPKAAPPPPKSVISLYRPEQPHRVSQVTDELYRALLDWLRTLEARETAQERGGH